LKAPKRSKKKDKSIFNPVAVELQPDPWEPIGIDQFYEQTGQIDEFKKKA